MVQRLSKNATEEELMMLMVEARAGGQHKLTVDFANEVKHVTSAGGFDADGTGFHFAFYSNSLD